MVFLQVLNLDPHTTTNIFLVVGLEHVLLILFFFHTLVIFIIPADSLIFLRGFFSTTRLLRQHNDTAGLNARLEDRDERAQREKSELLEPVQSLLAQLILAGAPKNCKFGMVIGCDSFFSFFFMHLTYKVYIKDTYTYADKII